MSDIRVKRSLKEILPRDNAGGSFRNHLPADDAPAPRPRNIDWAPRRRLSSKTLIGIVVLVIVAGGALFASSVLAKITVKITPVQGRLLLNHTFDAYSTVTEGELAFSLVSNITDTEKKIVPASGSEKVSRKAGGTIIIYNNYDNKVQKLVVNTRFETSDGKIYRITAPVSVPGMTTQGGQATPGSVEVAVVADQAGAEYNIGLTDFTIPGFKDDPRYAKFYARSKTEMTGGYVGEIKKVSADDKAKAIAELETVLSERMVKEAKLQIPANFILFDDAYFLTFEEQLPGTGSSTPTTGDQAEVVLKGTFHGILFDRKALSYKIAKDQIPEFDGRELEIKNLNELKFKLLNRESIKGPEVEKVSFTLEGNAHLIWSFNQNELIAKLQSAGKNDYQGVFAQFPTIKQAEIVFFPPWVKNIPENKDKINIEVNTND
ncbi:MAG: hypothetical protein KBC48_01260 [Candidatus Pacebacteria bacterium]|nr:hypothetical protein [Candidatus Paceibacterota bacterium]